MYIEKRVYFTTSYLAYWVLGNWTGKRRMEGRDMIFDLAVSGGCCFLNSRAQWFREPTRSPAADPNPVAIHSASGTIN